MHRITVSKVVAFATVLRTFSSPLLARASGIRTFCALHLEVEGSSDRANKLEMMKTAKETLKNAQVVCFDVDSTVIQEEGIDVLANFCGQGEAVAKLTADAMEGGMKFEDALEARLNLIQPSQEQILSCLKDHPFVLTPGIKAVVKHLHDRGTLVFLISGGFRNMIIDIADELGIPEHRIYANTIIFDSDGKYSSFDAEEPTSRDGGKGEVIQRLKNEYGYSPVVMIGDGATDLQSRPPADSFIGFGGVEQREVVKENADWFITDFNELLTELKSE
jgi:phosphoserine phosphatase